jgi:hypothetical protein
MIKYVPATPPTDPNQMQSYLLEEFRKIQTSLETVHDHEVIHVAPEKVEDGMDRYADGTNWDPIGDGSEGRVSRENGTWVKL